MIPLIVIFVAHWIGDFLSQTKEIADKKNESVVALTTHVMIYTVWMAIALAITAQIMGVVKNIDAFNFILFIWFIFITHWFVDFFTSKITHKLYKEQRWYGFFSVLGADQLIHTISLLYIFNELGII